MIKLAVFDVDGTLLSHETWVIPDSAISAIKQLKTKGIKIAMATGRPYYMMKSVTSVGIEIDYIIACNGHAVYDENRKVIASERFSYDQVENLTKFCVDNDYILSWKFTEGNYIYNRFEDLVEIHRKLQLDLNFVNNCVATRDRHKHELPFGGVVYGSTTEVEKYRTTKDSGIVFLPFEKDSFDVSLANVNKGSGLKRLLERINIDFAECIAIGDAQNDVEMVKAAGIGIAMKGCCPELAAVADYQTDTIMDDGVAKALVHYGLIDSY